jgi:hypothetical protein
MNEDDEVWLLVFPDGYVLEAAGPYYCDAKNNDAEIIKHHYDNSDLLLFLEENDYFLWDRGYRDATSTTTRHKINSFMPDLLPKNRTEFTCEEANNTRKVTMTRWVVEAANGRLKNVFPFFKHMIEGSYTPKIMRFVRIACAIFNKYFPAINPPQEFHARIAELIELHDNNENPLKTEIEEQGLKRMNNVRWQKATPASVPDFPKLSYDDLKMMTLGSYQLDTANNYNQEHMNGSSEYEIFIHRDTENIIRAMVQSRFIRCKSHPVWTKYEPGKNDLSGLLGRLCGCKVGERTLGACSHVSAVSFTLFPNNMIIC